MMSRNGNGSHQDATEIATLTKPQLDAITALVEGATMTEAAKRVGVDRSTLWRWREKDPAFGAELNRALMEVRQQARGELRKLVTRAVKTVRNLMAIPTPAPTRLRAALVVLESVGALDPLKVGPVDPDDLADLKEQEDLDNMMFRQQCRSRRRELETYDQLHRSVNGADD